MTQQSAPATSCHRGFTLMELLITLGLLVILSAAAVPSFQEYIRNQRVKSASQELFATLLYSRGEAIKRNANVYLYPNGGNWEDGWIITTVAARTYAQCTVSPMPADCLKIQPAQAGVDVSTAAASVVYDGKGRVAAAVSFDLCDAAGSAGVAKRQVSTDLTGRPNIAHVVGGCA